MIPLRSPQALGIKVPLGQAIRQKALEFAATQRNVTRGKQVYLNTLAVHAVHSYLKWLGIDSRLEQSHSWDPALRAVLDTADLMLPLWGRLECRPVPAGGTVCFIPPEVWDDRIGYLAVELDESLTEATLVGFLAHVPAAEELPLTEFQPPADLFEHLESLAPLTSLLTAAQINLGQWLSGVMESGWQTVTTLLDGLDTSTSLQPAFAFRGSPSASAADTGDASQAVAAMIQLIQSAPDLGTRLRATELIGRIGYADPAAISTLTELLKTSEDENLRWQAALSLGQIDPQNALAAIARGRKVDLGLALAGHPLNLIVAIMPESQDEVSILVKVLPTEGQTYLPEDLQLSVLDDQDTVVDQTTARLSDNAICLSFSAQTHERFSIQMKLNESTYTEEFLA